MRVLCKDQDGRLLHERTVSPGDPELIVGRDPACDICIEHLSISRRHLRLRAVSATALEVRDLHSSFGTFIDGRKMAPDQPATVEGIAIIQLSKEIFIFTEPAASAGCAERPTPPPGPAATAGDLPELLGGFEERNRQFVEDSFADIGRLVPDENFSALLTVKDRLARKVGHLSAIITASYALNSITHYQRLLEYVMDVAIRVIGAERGCLSIYDEGQRRFETVVARRMGNQEIEQEMRTSQSLIRSSFETGETLVITDVNAAGDVAQRQSIVANQIKSVAISPLFYNGSGIGVLYLDNRMALAANFDENREVLEVFAALASVAVNNARLHYLATTDSLTELTNRRAFLQRLLEEFYRSRRYGLDLSLIIIDLDRFKAINDHHGHPAGDRVLKTLGAILKSHVRVHDLPGRYGGEEFVVLLPQTNLDGAAVLAEKLRSLVEATPFAIADDRQLACTISVGVAQIDAARMSEPMALVKAADEALYQAKQTGRNRVVRAPLLAPEPAPTPATGGG